MESNQLLFATSTNCDYAVEWIGRLGDPSLPWNNLTNLPGTGAEVALPAASTNTARFFQLRIERR